MRAKRGLSSGRGLLFFSSGHVSAQRVALQVQISGKNKGVAVSSFIEELVVRRELTDNFCYYNPKYDSVEGQCRSPPSARGSVSTPHHYLMCPCVVPRSVRVGPEDPERSRQRQKAIYLHAQAAGGGQDARQTLERCSGTTLLNQEFRKEHWHEKMCTFIFPAQIFSKCTLHLVSDGH